VHLVGFIIKKFVTMQRGHMNVKYLYLVFVLHLVGVVNEYRDPKCKE
jgi:hypothetical protein